ncbi:FxsB family cyclophane-forming radical SAM/SPASM peptide maturase [Actinoallomurus oryzae]|uniref:FxsB family cyclophane-forming radical SAM/SPASM peptide maturase n=1 Tax=Actinoallomurus oryzae TaxID=502180 RepID=UPI0031ECE56F
MGTRLPFRQFVLKVQSRCDLACDHCYVYEHADQSWRGKPITMAVETMAQVATRIGEHAKSQGIDRVHAVLHGGEPLLCGPERLSALIRALESGVRGICDLDLHIHTNGVLLDRRFCELFRAHDVKVGISLDGDRAANDRHRRYRDGRSSFDKVARAIELLRTGYPEIYSGLLCTIDVRNDPIAVYDALVSHDPPAIDLLLPHATWDDPPFRAGETDYADWLAAIFDKWLADGRPVPIRTFDSIISTSRGGPALTESLGLEPSDLLVVETDGTFEQADSIKIAFDGAPETGKDVFRHSIDQVAEHEGLAARQRGSDGLSATCRACPVLDSCGGGLFAHRYRTGSGFDNPSVFCADLKKLIEHVERRVSAPRHPVPRAALRSIAAGQGTVEALTILQRGQRSIRRALIASVRGQAGPSPEWDLLCRIEPAIVDEVFAHPYNRVWAVDRLRGPDRRDDGRLAALACAAAARAGMSATLRLPVTDGAVFLPTVGRYEVPGASETTVEIRDGEITVERAAAVHRVRRLEVGGHPLMVEDLDPVRDCHGRPAAGRLTDEQAGHWQAVFGAAWDIIAERCPEYLPTLTGALSAVVPVVGEPAGSSARNAFGSVALALPPDPETLCVLLLRETQRIKLGGVLDMLDLFEPRASTVSVDTQRLLSDSYARLAVTDFRRRRSQGRFGIEAATDVKATLDSILASDSLTRLGRGFVEEMRRTLDAWSA